MNAVFGEKLFRIIASLAHVTAQTGQVFGDDGIGFPLLQLAHHLLESRTVKVTAGIAIVNKFSYQRDAVLFAIILHDHALIGNTGGFPALRFFVGESQVGKTQR